MMLSTVILQVGRADVWPHVFVAVVKQYYRTVVEPVGCSLCAFGKRIMESACSLCCCLHRADEH